MIKTGTYARPSRWLALDAFDGDLIANFSCKENDCSIMPFSQLRSKSDPSVTAPNDDYYKKMDEFFDKARLSFLSPEGFDMSAYNGYMGMLMEITPKDFRIFYTELSKPV